MIEKLAIQSDGTLVGLEALSREDLDRHIEAAQRNVHQALGALSLFAEELGRRAYEDGEQLELWSEGEPI